MKTVKEMAELMRQLVDEKGWSSPKSTRQQTPKNIACSLSIEAAEVLEHGVTPELTRSLSSALYNSALMVLPS